LHGDEVKEVVLVAAAYEFLEGFYELLLRVGGVDKRVDVLLVGLALPSLEL